MARGGASAELAALAERLGAPILGEPLAATVPLPTDHPLWQGPLPPFAAEIAPLLAPHDVVLAVGMPVFRLFGTSPGSALPPETTLVHLEVDPHEVGKVHAPAVGLVGDLASGLAGLRERLGPAPADVRERCVRAMAEVAAARAAARARVEAAAVGDRVGPAGFARAVAAAVERDDLVVDEALTAGRGLRAVIGPRTPSTWLAHRGSALGWGLPAAVGAALADPGRRVLALQGDGSFVFGAPALWTAAHEGLPLALVVADNGGYEILRAGLEGMTGRPEGDWPGLALRRAAAGRRGHLPRIRRLGRPRRPSGRPARGAPGPLAAGSRGPGGARGGRLGPHPRRGLSHPGGRRVGCRRPAAAHRGALILPAASMRAARDPKSWRESVCTWVTPYPPGPGVPEPTSWVGRNRPERKRPSGDSVTCRTPLWESTPPSEKTS